jgi:hypothetical protein
LQSFLNSREFAVLHSRLLSKPTRTDCESHTRLPTDLYTKENIAAWQGAVTRDTKPHQFNWMTSLRMSHHDTQSDFPGIGPGGPVTDSDFACETASHCQSDCVPQTYSHTQQRQGNSGIKYDSDAVSVDESDTLSRRHVRRGKKSRPLWKPHSRPPSPSMHPTLNVYESNAGGSPLMTRGTGPGTNNRHQATNSYVDSIVRMYKKAYSRRDSLPSQSASPPHTPSDSDSPHRRRGRRRRSSMYDTPSHGPSANANVSSGPDSGSSSSIVPQFASPSARAAIAGATTCTTSSSQQSRHTAQAWNDVHEKLDSMLDSINILDMTSDQKLTAYEQKRRSESYMPLSVASELTQLPTGVVDRKESMEASSYFAQRYAAAVAAKKRAARTRAKSAQRAQRAQRAQCRTSTARRPHIHVCARASTDPRPTRRSRLSNASIHQGTIARDLCATMDDLVQMKRRNNSIQLTVQAHANFV